MIDFATVSQGMCEFSKKLTGMPFITVGISDLTVCAVSTVADPTLNPDQIIMALIEAATLINKRFPNPEGTVPRDIPAMLTLIDEMIQVTSVVNH